MDGRWAIPQDRPNEAGGGGKEATNTPPGYPSDPRAVSTAQNGAQEVEQPPQVSQGGSGQDAAQKAAEREQVARALRDHRWGPGRPWSQPHSKSHYMPDCALCRPDLDDGYGRIVDVVLAAAHLLRDAPGQDAGDEGLRGRVAALADEWEAREAEARHEGTAGTQTYIRSALRLRALLDPEAKP